MQQEAWEFCRVNPYRGFAFFDGIFIEADSIYNPRWDRVIPVFEEEQVFVSRLMDDKLDRGKRVLDLGTGSGVYAIVAAKAGCRVLAVDKSRRACMFAANNAYQNRIRISNHFDNIEDGEIFVLHDEVKQENLGDFSSQHGAFDIVILSPPYTPTHPDLKDRLAVHAAAGEIGEAEFQRQITIAAQLLGPQGVCIGNQLTPVTGRTPLPKGVNTFAELLRDKELRERLLMLKDIRAAFKDQFSLRLVPILPLLKSTEEFLGDQYGDLRGELKGLDRWIQTVSQENPYLALLYYEVFKNGDGQVSCAVPPWDDLPEQPSHRRDWNYRVSLHKAVVEHTSELGFTPLPLLIAEGATDAVISRKRDSPDIERRLPPDDIYGVNLYSLIDKEIRSQQLEKLFSIVFMDTTPIVETEEGIRRLINQNRIWIDGKADFAQSQERKNLSEQLLDIWLCTVTALQHAKCGPFAHAAFIGLADSVFKWKWPEVVSTEFPLTEAQAQELHIAKRIVETDFIPELDKIFASKAGMPKAEVIADLGFSRVSLGELKVSDYESNERQRLIRLQKLEQQLSRAGMRDKVSSPARLDLRACQYVMHATIHNRFKQRIDKTSSNLMPNHTESLLLSMPLGMLFYHDDTSITTSSRGFPPYYKGVFWALLVPRGRQRPVHEKAAQHLLRVAWLISNGAYGAKSERALINYYSYEGKLSVTHQLTKDIHALNYRIENFNTLVDKTRLEHPGVPIPKFSPPDEFSFSVMQASALDKTRPLIELPEECAKMLAGTWNTEIIKDLVIRLVEYPSKQRVKSEVGDSPDTPSRKRQHYPTPECSVPQEFKLNAPSKGLYPLVILALRNAYQHAYLHTILSHSQQPGQIEIRHEILDNGGEGITIANSGQPEPQEKGSRQFGWERDLRVFHGVTGGWRVEKSQKGQYSFYSGDETGTPWKTRIVFSKDSDRDG